MKEQMLSDRIKIENQLVEFSNTNLFDPKLVYISSLLKTKLPKTFKQLTGVFEKYNIQYGEIENTKDIWVRDFMPILLDPNLLIQFSFNPRNLKGYDELKTNPKECYPHGLVPVEVDLILDGGNVVLGKHHVILTDYVFKENPLLRKEEVLQRLADSFGFREVVIIPKESGDIFGHSDGMLRFLNEDTVMVNNYAKIGVSSSFIAKLYGALGSANLNIIQCPYYPDETGLNVNDVPSAAGNYINFLETEHVVFIPQTKIGIDGMAMKVFKKYFKKEVVGIDCQELAEHGGLLNCITWSNMWQM